MAFKQVRGAERLFCSCQEQLIIWREGETISFIYIPGFSWAVFVGTLYNKEKGGQEWPITQYTQPVFAYVLRGSSDAYQPFLLDAFVWRCCFTASGHSGSRTEIICRFFLLLKSLAAIPNLLHCRKWIYKSHMILKLLCLGIENAK